MSELWMTQFNGRLSLSSKSLDFQANQTPQSMVTGRALYLFVSLFIHQFMRASSMEFYLQALFKLVN
jgi:hypothetical protein